MENSAKKKMVQQMLPFKPIAKSTTPENSKSSQPNSKLQDTFKLKRKLSDEDKESANRKLKLMKSLDADNSNIQTDDVTIIDSDIDGDEVESNTHEEISEGKLFFKLSKPRKRINKSNPKTECSTSVIDEPTINVNKSRNGIETTENASASSSETDIETTPIKIDNTSDDYSSTEIIKQDSLHSKIVGIEYSDSDNAEPEKSAVPITIPTIVTTVDSNSKRDENILTPKQITKKQNTEQKLLERSAAKIERERKLQEEKDKRQRDRDEKEQLRRRDREEKEELKKRERDEKEEQRRKEKEEREQKKQAEIEIKNQEKRKREEQKDEERRRKEEDKRKKEEVTQRKQIRESVEFKKFFLPKQKCITSGVHLTDLICNSYDTQESVEKNLFMPFSIKGDMKLSPISRRILSTGDKGNLDKLLYQKTELTAENHYNLYVHCLKLKTTIIGRCGKTWLNDVDDVVIVEDELELDALLIPENNSVKAKYRAKYLKFHENRRPAYYGTWRKKSRLIRPRKPFAIDKTFFDYEIDSDDEWEEEELPGESLHGSDEEKDVESDDDYDIDNEFFVPHGHLSDEEMANEDEDGDKNGGIELQKAKLKIIQTEFDAEMKRKTERIKPRLMGLIWQNRETSKEPLPFPKVICELLRTSAMLTKCPVIIAPNESTIELESGGEDNCQIRKKPIKIIEEYFPDLIRLIYGNINGKSFMIKEFKAYLSLKNGNEPNFQEFSKISIQKKINEFAAWGPCPDIGPMFGRYCWHVPKETLAKYKLDNLSYPNTWSYVLKPPRTQEIKESSISINTKVHSMTEQDHVAGKLGKTHSTKTNSIRKFIKLMSCEEKQSGLNSNQQTKQEKLTELLSVPEHHPSLQVDSDCPLSDSPLQEGKNG